MKCIVCKKRDAIKDRFYGYLPCNECQIKAQKPKSPEIIPDRIKEDRKAHSDDTVQPFRGGVVSKEYLKLYGTKHIKVTEKEVKNAKNTWDGYYND